MRLKVSKIRYAMGNLDRGSKDECWVEIDNAGVIWIYADEKSKTPIMILTAPAEIILPVV